MATAKEGTIAHIEVKPLLSSDALHLGHTLEVTVSYEGGSSNLPLPSLERASQSHPR